MKNKKFAMALLNAIIPEEIESIEELETRSAPTSQSQSSDSLSAKKPRRSSTAELLVSDYQLCAHEEKGLNENDKTVIFDFVCQTKTGEIINVEMQRASQIYYLHRALFYSSRLISRQGYSGKDSENRPWNWKISRMYHIGILDFALRIDQIPSACHDSWKLWLQLGINGKRSEPTVELSSQDSFSPDLLHICLISLSKFRTVFDQKISTLTELQKFAWLFANLSSCDIDKVPEWCKASIYQEILESMRMSQLSRFESQKYDFELTQLRNEAETTFTARLLGKDEGKKEGIEIGIQIGKDKGKKEGIEIGREEGVEKGIQIGREEGVEKGIQMAMKTLYSSLRDRVGHEAAYEEACKIFGKENFDKISFLE